MGRPYQHGILADMLYGIADPNPFSTSAAPTKNLSWVCRAYSIPPSPPRYDGIWFARTNGSNLRFSEAFAFPVDTYGVLTGVLRRIGHPPDPGIYAIVVHDNSASPRPFRVLYFGESENMTERVTSAHEHYHDWCRAGGGADNIHVAYHFMFSSSKHERLSIESGLIGHYHPVCNRQFNPLAGLFGQGGMR